MISLKIPCHLEHESDSKTIILDYLKHSIETENIPSVFSDWQQQCLDAYFPFEFPDHACGLEWLGVEAEISPLQICVKSM